MGKLLGRLRHYFLLLRQRWRQMSGKNRNWLVGIFIGILIEFVVLSGGGDTVAAVRQSGMDSLNRLNVNICRYFYGSDDTDGAQGSWMKKNLQCDKPQYYAVTVTDRTWHSKEWGGGKPVVSPRQPLVEAVDKAFAMGADQVILDFDFSNGDKLDEHDLARFPLKKEIERQNGLFADGLRTLLDKQYFGNGKQLILMRSLDMPVFYDNRQAVLPMLQPIEQIDRVAAQSGGRIQIASPYFKSSGNRIAYEWELFKTFCAANKTDDRQGRVAVLPSAQLLVAMHYYGASLPDWKSGQACTLFNRVTDIPPESEQVFQACRLEGILDKRYADRSESCLQAESLCTQKDFGNHEFCQNRLSPEQKTGGVHLDYWQQIQQSFLDSPSNIRLAGLPVSTEIGNRIMYRYPQDDAAVIRIDIDDFLLSDGNMFSGIKNKIVVIGGEWSSSPDWWLTPLNNMSGVVLLINAIDSMITHQLFQNINPWVIHFFSLILIVATSYMYSRWSSFTAMWAATIMVLCTTGLISFLLFSKGLWLDFALPIFCIQLHQLWVDIRDRFIPPPLD